MPKQFEADVCIVGAGPSGAFLGYLLAKKGLLTVVLERTSGKAPAFRGEHISAETEQMLKEHDLLHKVEEKGLLRTERVDFEDHGEVLKTIIPGPNEEHVGIHVPQAHLLEPILTEAKKYPNFQIFYQTKVTELQTDEQGLYTGVVAKQEDDTWVINSKIIIGADGRYSTIRKLADIPVTKRDHGYDVLWAKIPAPAGWEPVIKNLLVDGKQLAVFTQALGYVQIGWNIPKGSYPSLKKQPVQQMLKPLVEHLPILGETVEAHIQSWHDMILLDVFSAKSSTWVKNNLVIIGDAAHTMTPTGAYGINAGMKDAYVLAPLIKDVLQTNDFSLLHLFEQKRRGEIEALYERQIDTEKNYADHFKQASLA